MIDPADTVTRPLPVTSSSPICLRFASTDGSYMAVLQQDLLAEWIVIESWGGKTNQRGRGQVVPVPSFEDGCALLQSITRRREKHGYRLLDSRLYC